MFWSLSCKITNAGTDTSAPKHSPTYKQTRAVPHRGMPAFRTSGSDHSHNPDNQQAYRQ